MWWILYASVLHFLHFWIPKEIISFFLAMCVPLDAFWHPHVLLLKFSTLHYPVFQLFCTKRLLVYFLISISQHFAMFFSGAKIYSHGSISYFSNKMQQLTRDKQESSNVFRKLCFNSFCAFAKLIEKPHLHHIVTVQQLSCQFFCFSDLKRWDLI